MRYVILRDDDTNALTPVEWLERLYRPFLDRDLPVKWYHVERILKALGLSPDGERWRELRAWWYTSAERRKPESKAEAK